MIKNRASKLMVDGGNPDTQIVIIDAIGPVKEDGWNGVRDAQ